jgi:nitrogen fixation NifU-like protein
MSLNELYQEVIIDHSQHPRNFSEMPSPTHKGEGHNPLCGDKIKVFLKFENGKVVDIKFQGSGCAISTASASMMTESLQGLSQTEIEALFHRFHQLITNPEAESSGPDLGKLEVFAGVGEFPTRVKCATLAWHTVMAALKNEKQPAKTE